MAIMFHHVNCHRLFVFTASRKVVDYWLASSDTSTCCIFFLNHALVFTAFSPPKMNPHFDERFCTFLYCTNELRECIYHCSIHLTAPHKSKGWIMAPHWNGSTYFVVATNFICIRCIMQACRLEKYTAKPRNQGKPPKKNLPFSGLDFHISARKWRSTGNRRFLKTGGAEGFV